MEKKPRSKNNYVDNVKLHQEFLDWHDRLKEDENSQPSAYIAKSIILICENYSRRYNFAGYTYREDMVGEAIIACTRYIKNFNPYLYKNPHAYFTRIAQNCFLKIIRIEKRETAIKCKKFVTEVYDAGDYDITSAVDADMFIDMVNKVEDYEETVRKQRVKADDGDETLLETFMLGEEANEDE